MTDMATILLNASEEGSSTLSDSILNTQQLMSVFGLASAAFIIVSFILFKRQRKFPTDLIFYLSLAQFLFPASQLLCSTKAVDDNFWSTGARAVFGVSQIFRCVFSTRVVQ